MDNLEFANICRVCLSTNNLTNLQEVGYIIGLFRNITNIQIESFDELPQNICNQCIEKLDSISNFITLSKQNDTFLRQALLNNTRIKTELDLNADINQNKSEETDEKYNNEVYIKTEPESESQYENECDNLDFKISERDLSKSEPEFTEEADSSDEVCFIEKKQLANLDLLPPKSKNTYERSFRRFEKYMQEKNIEAISENVLLTYLTELSEKNKASTLWSTYSIIKTCLSIKQNINISKYMKLRAFLKKKNAGYVPKQSKTLSRGQFEKFLENAPNDKYLMHKVAFIFGIAGGCRCDELAYLKLDQIENLDTSIVIRISPRSFTVTGKYFKYYHDYLLLRPKDFNNDGRFFLLYRHGKCYKQYVGIHKIGAIPFEIATYLNLPNAKEYTGHCFRRTSATLLADSQL